MPHALALAGVHSVDEIGGALTASVSLAVSSLFEKYWFLRKSAPETLRGVIARLPGGREVRIESSGQGGVLGSMLGALMMAFLASGCKMTGSATYVQEILIGTIIVVAVSVDVLQRRRA